MLTFYIVGAAVIFAALIGITIYDVMKYNPKYSWPSFGDWIVLLLLMGGSWLSILIIGYILYALHKESKTWD